MVVPCYNKEKYISDMLASVHAQKWDNLELVLVNDGSTDGTRQVIEEWLPRFANRGYETIVIDQENQGVAAAVRNGMLRMSGEYFCTADCDDLLMPNYVDKMAGWLESNPECDWVVCKVNLFLDMTEQTAYPVVSDFISEDEAMSSNHFNRIINYLFRNIAVGAYNYMVRSEYVYSCKITEKYYTTPPISQEPTIHIRIAAGGGRMVYFPEKLYRYRQGSRGRSNIQSLDGWEQYESNFYKSCREIIDGLELVKGQKEWLKKLTFLAKDKALAMKAYAYDDTAVYLNKLTANVRRHFFSSFPEIQISALNSLNTSGLRVFFRALENHILQKEYSVRIQKNRDLLENGRVFAYGVLGRIGRELIPALINTPFCPTFFWDHAARKSAKVCDGGNIVEPNFSMLKRDDCVILITRQETAYNEVLQELSKKEGVNVLTYFDILDVLGSWYYPDLFKGIDGQP